MASNGALVLVETHGTGHLQDGRPTTTAMPGRSSCAASKIAVLREYLDSYYIVRLFGMT